MLWVSEVQGECLAWYNLSFNFCTEHCITYYHKILICTDRLSIDRNFKWTIWGESKCKLTDGIAMKRSTEVKKEKFE